MIMESVVHLPSSIAAHGSGAFRFHAWVEPTYFPISSFTFVFLTSLIILGSGTVPTYQIKNTRSPRRSPTGRASSEACNEPIQLGCIWTVVDCAVNFSTYD